MRRTTTHWIVVDDKWRGADKDGVPKLVSYDAVVTDKQVKVAGGGSALRFRSILDPNKLDETPEAAISRWRNSLTSALEDLRKAVDSIEKLLAQEPKRPTEQK